MTLLSNILLIVLLPLTLLTATAWRDTYRLHGPDVMGPAFALVVAGGLRYLLAAVAIGLLVASGKLDPLIPTRPLQFLTACAAFALIDLAAAITINATSRADEHLSPAMLQLAATAGWTTPFLAIVGFLILANAPAPTPMTLRTTAALLLAFAYLPVPSATRAISTAAAISTRQREDYWAEQKRLTEEGTASLAAIPDDAPLEKLLPFLTEDRWPAEVRGPAWTRVENRPRLHEELTQLLSDPDPARVDLAINYIGQLDPTPPDFAAPFARAALRRASEMEPLAASLPPAEIPKLTQLADHCVNVAYRLSAHADFHPAVDAWKRTMDLAPATGTGNVESSRSNINAWYTYHPQTPPPTTAPSP